ncbi:uncharacterized protein SEPMUDRAFT_134233 [Sphaerulina musiva SO2202]|uniref:Uncharacterized protein n=1 Tax=Sphaerulina musiva (strain SO2202) TaxID=692275 RepID=M3BUI3_SPHMS|nr:uncharacterized protein SEPMUDRAFT_134233 [Sphaerulina musiva SO2202]EMF10994.1 hypothetical protein SEPMUDRAFT_126620 [Sphaerulina musiva SO2202]
MCRRDSTYLGESRTLDQKVQKQSSRERPARIGKVAQSKLNQGWRVLTLHWSFHYHDKAAFGLLYICQQFRGGKDHAYRRQNRGDTDGDNCSICETKGTITALVKRPLSVIMLPIQLIRVCISCWNSGLDR